jgi:hypothetical protein
MMKNKSKNLKMLVVTKEGIYLGKECIKEFSSVKEFLDAIDLKASNYELFLSKYKIKL